VRRISRGGSVERWEYAPSIRIVCELVGERMFPLTIAGLDQAITALKQRDVRPYPAPPEHTDV
jgi:hypothetical protein